MPRQSLQLSAQKVTQIVIPKARVVTKEKLLKLVPVNHLPIKYYHITTSILID